MLIVVAQSLFNIQLRRMRGSINFFVSVLLSDYWHIYGHVGKLKSSTVFNNNF